MARRYPDVRVRLHSRNPLALVSAVRQALRRCRVDRREIDLFTEEALRSREPDRIRDVCAAWAAVELVGGAPG